MKKNFIAITLVALFFSMALTGCEKENINPKSKSVSELAPELQDLYKQMPQRNYSGITVIGDGILRFESEEILETTYDLLKKDCETWDDLFLERYAKLSDEEIDEKEIELDYSEYQPLIQFEMIKGVYGRMLLDQQQTALSQWYDKGMVGESPLDPIFIDEIEQALYNIHHEICVGDTIAQYREDGSIILIPISMINKINTIRNSSVDDIIMEGLLTVKKGGEKTYSDHQTIPFTSSEHYIYIDNSHRSSWQFQSHPKNVFGRPYVRIKSTVKLINWEFKNGKWRKTRRYCSVSTLLSHHAVINEQVSTNPPVSTVVHYQDVNMLFGNVMKAEKNRRSRTDTYTYSVLYPQNYVELGIGKEESKLCCKINSTDYSRKIFN